MGILPHGLGTLCPECVIINSKKCSLHLRPARGYCCSFTCEEYICDGCINYANKDFNDGILPLTYCNSCLKGKNPYAQMDDFEKTWSSRCLANISLGRSNNLLNFAIKSFGEKHLARSIAVKKEKLTWSEHQRNVMGTCNITKEPTKMAPNSNK